MILWSWNKNKRFYQIANNYFLCFEKKNVIRIRSRLMNFFSPQLFLFQFTFQNLYLIISCLLQQKSTLELLSLQFSLSIKLPWPISYTYIFLASEHVNRWARLKKKTLPTINFQSNKKSQSHHNFTKDTLARRKNVLSKLNLHLAYTYLLQYLR